METNVNETLGIKPLTKADPRPRKRGGSRGESLKTIARRNQLKMYPGEWHIWKEDARSGSDTGQVLRVLLGYPSMKGTDRNTLPFEATSRLNEDGKTWTIYARYVAGREEALV